LFFVPGTDDDIAEGRGVEGLLVLEFGRKVDAVVLTDVTDGLGRKFLGLGRDTHGVEDVTSGGQITAEGPGTDIRQTSQLALADETVFVVKVDHETE
jgi:hypothetical protein